MKQKKETSKEKVSHKIKPRHVFLIVKILIIAGAVCVVALGSYFGIKKFFQVKVENLHKTLSSQIENVAELTTLKNNYSDVVCIKKSTAGGMAKSYSIVKYNGVIRAGVKDFSSIKINISKDAKKVTVTLHRVEVLGNGLISQEVFDEKSSIFVPITTQEIFTEIQNGMKSTQDEIVKQGFLIEAEYHLKSIVKTFLTSCGFEEIEIYCL